MKKIVIAFALSVVSIAGFANEIVKRPWWQTVIIDASGGLSGVTAVSNWCRHWICLGIGAIIGGAGASLARMGEAIPDNEPVRNDANDMDYVGERHNQVLKDFLQAGKRFEPGAFIEFVKQQSGKYDMKVEEYINRDFMGGIVKNVQHVEINNAEDAFNFLSPQLPASIDKQEFRKYLGEILAHDQLEDFYKATLSAENHYLAMRTLPEKDMIALKCFFSTLRHSAALWYVKPQ